MLPLLSDGIALPTTLPDALAEAEVDTPLECWRKPGKVNSDVPLERWVKKPLFVQSTAITPGDPPNVKKLGLPAVLVLRCSCLPPPLTSLAGIWPNPCRKLQPKKGSHCSMK